MSAGDLTHDERGVPFWDEAFTRLLLDAVPDGAATLIDVGCGSGAAARTLLPARPKLHYLGVDLDEEALGEASRALADTGLAARVTLRCAPAHRLPVYDGTAEVVLFVLALERVAAVSEVLAEAARALVGGGQLVAVEADNLGARFYFDGPLEEVTSAFAQLCRSAAEARRQSGQGDLALGPRLPGLIEAAGLRVGALRVHAMQRCERESLSLFRDRLRAMVGKVAPALDEESAPRVAFARALEALGEERIGWTGHVVPAFVVTATRPEVFLS